MVRVLDGVLYYIKAASIPQQICMYYIRIREPALTISAECRTAATAQNEIFKTSQTKIKRYSVDCDNV